MATILKIRPNYARVRVQVDLAADLPKVVHMVVVDESTIERRINNTKIQYNALPKYWKEGRLQGHNDEECMKLNSLLRKYYKESEEKGNNDQLENTCNQRFASNAFPLIKLRTLVA